MPVKQLIRFSPHSSTTCSAIIYFCNQTLAFSDSVYHLGHTLKCDDDVLLKALDLVKKANHLYIFFWCWTKYPHSPIPLLLSISLWCSTVVPQQSLNSSSEVSFFNKLLRRIWRLPARSHTTIVHHIARLPSLFNVIHSRSLSLLHSADLCPSRLVKFIFRRSSLCSFAFCGFNSLYGQRYLKFCDTQYAMCADIIRIIQVDNQMLTWNILFELFHVTNIIIIIIIVVCSTPLLVCHIIIIAKICIYD